MHPTIALTDPVPLSTEQQAELLRHARIGDPIAVNKLVQHFLRVALCIARKKFSTHTAASLVAQLDESDIYEIASDGLLEAIKKFDSDRGREFFKKFLEYCVYHRGLNKLRTLRVRQSVVEKLAAEPGVSAVEHSAANDDLWKMRNREFEIALRQENPTTQEIVRSHLDGTTFAEIAAKLRFKSPSSAQSRYSGFVKKFQDNFKVRFPEYYGKDQ